MIGPRGRIFPTLQVMRDPSVLIRWRERYGDPFGMKALNGDLIITGRPELAREVFALPDDAFSPFAVQTLAPVLGSGSLLLLEGEQHRRHRRRLVPPFQKDDLAFHAETIRTVAERRCASWSAGETIRAVDEARRVTFEVIVRVVFGVEDQVETFAAASEEVLARIHPIHLFSRHTQRSFFGLSPWDRFQRAKKRVVDLLLGVIDERRRTGVRGRDVLSRLLDSRDEEGLPLDDDDIVSTLLTLLVAGHETSTVALAWALHHAAREPERLGQLRKDVAAGRHEWLDAWSKETLRRDTIVDTVMRTLTKPWTLDGRELSPGTTVGVCPYLLHRDPHLFPEPEHFRPERFLERSFRPFEWIPFGGGVRRCIGAGLALLEMRIVLGSWLSRFDFETKGDSPEVQRRNLLLAPSNGVPLATRSAA